MDKDVYQERLDWFKQREKPEVVLLVSHRPIVTRLVVAWTNIRVERIARPTRLRGDTEEDIWDWLWENVRYSKRTLAEKADVLTSLGVASALKPLIGNRILYPDGTINSFVQRYLRDRVLKLFKSKIERGPQGARRSQA